MLARDVRRVAAAGRMWASRGCVVPVGDGSAKRVDGDVPEWDYEGCVGGVGEGAVEGRGDVSLGASRGCVASVGDGL